MKKTLLALAVPAAFFATAANAGIPLYQANGVTVDLSASTEVQIIKDYGKFNGFGVTQSDAEIRLAEGDIALNTSVALTPTASAIAGIGLEFDQDDLYTEELWAGISSNYGAFTLGRQYLIADDVGIAKDYEFGRGIEFGIAHGDQTAKYVYDNGQFYGGFSALIVSDGVKHTDKEPTVIDGRIGARFGELDARLYVYSADDLDHGNLAQTGFNIETEYAINKGVVAASYGQTEFEIMKNKFSYDYISVAAQNKYGAHTLSAGYDYIKPESGSSINNLYINAATQLHANVEAYAELGFNDAEYVDISDGKKVSSEFGYVVGLKIAI